MPIIRTIPSSDFTINANDLFKGPMPLGARSVLLYLLSKPANWQVRAHDIQRQLCQTAYTVRKALRWLCSAGYAYYIRQSTGKTVWSVFSKPQTPSPLFTPEVPSAVFATETVLPVFTPEVPSPLFTPEAVMPVFASTAATPALPPRVEFSHIENQPVLTIFQTEEIKKQQHETLPEPQKTVVVSCEDNESLKYPEQLSKDQKKYIKAKIKTAPVDLQQDVLFELAYRMTLQTIHNVAGYVNNLIIAANNGTFTRTGGNGSVKKVNPAIAATQALFDKQASFKRSDKETYEKNMAGLKEATRGVR
jgi:hypothetical protein